MKAQFIYLMLLVFKNLLEDTYNASVLFPQEAALSLAIIISVIGIGGYIRKLYRQKDNSQTIIIDADGSVNLKYIEDTLHKLDTRTINNFQTLEANIENIRGKVLAVYKSIPDDNFELQLIDISKQVDILNKKVDLINTVYVNDGNVGQMTYANTHDNTTTEEDEESYVTIISALDSMTISQLQNKTSKMDIGSHPKTKLDWIHCNMCTQARKAIDSGNIYDVWEYYPQSVIKYIDKYPDQFKNEFIELIASYNKK
jgi:hypothetical protein